MSVKVKNNAMKVKHDGVYKDVGMIIGNASGVIDSIRSEGALQKQGVQLEGAAQTNAIDAKGAEVIASIPADYSQLSGEVSQLSESITNIEHSVNKIFPIDVVRSRGYLAFDGTFINENTAVSKHTDIIRCSEGDVFLYKGVGKHSAYSCIFYNGGSIVDKKQYDSKDEYVEVVIPSGVNGVIFSSYADGQDYERISFDITSQELPEAEKKYIRDRIAAMGENDVANVYVKKEIIQSINLIDGSKYVDGKFLVGVGSVSASGYCYTEPQLLKAGTYVTNCFKGSYGGNALRVFKMLPSQIDISTTLLHDDGNKSVMKFVLSEDTYISFNAMSASVDSVLMVVEGSTLEDFPTYFVPYSRKIIVEENVCLNDTMVSEVKKISQGNVLANKKLSVNGDSICFGAGYVGGYAKIIGENNSMTVQNIGVGGGTIAAETYSGTTARHWISRSMSRLDENADYIIVEGGVNDASLSVPLGEISNGYGNSFDDTTFYGAIESMFSQLITRFAGKKYGFIIVHQMTSGMLPPDGAYYKAILKCAVKWGIPILDLSDKVPPFGTFPSGSIYSTKLRDVYTKNDTGIGDGWHPNEEGYRKYYVPKIEAWMKTL